MFLIRFWTITVWLFLSAAWGSMAADVQPFTTGSWTMAVIPDTQYYARNDNDAPLFTEMTQWLVDYREKMNIRLVLHLGDIVDRNTVQQWTNAKKSLKVLDGKSMQPQDASAARSAEEVIRQLAERAGSRPLPLP